MQKIHPELNQVDKDLFDKVMRLIEHIGDQEKHFNNLETQYRTLASTWLLAALGACGYVLKAGAEFPFDKWYIIFGICVSGAVGISILGMLDMRVYQKLLHAFFIEGIRLEIMYADWLLPFRINILRSQGTREVTFKVQFYYLISVSLLVVLGNISIWNFSSLKSELAIRIIIILSITVLFLLILRTVFVGKGKERRRFEESEIGIMLKNSDRAREDSNA
jgi:hypothetical protein